MEPTDIKIKEHLDAERLTVRIGLELDAILAQQLTRLVTRQSKNKTGYLDVYLLQVC
jgi:anti-anti-sigma regulatory factor